ncbi:OmpA family protein [Flavobacteriales bacterium]|nr:OmpA family protein [Flavobacteriales bacterium]
MKRIFVILIFFPILSFSQEKDYKNFDRAVKYNSEGNIQKAIKYANKALEKDPDWSTPNLLLASIYANDKQIELAVNYLLKVYSETEPKDLKGIEQVAILYYTNGFYNKALLYFNNIFNKYKDQYKLNANIERYINNCEFAIEALKNPIEFNPVNLGSNINSEFEEYFPAISVDGKILVYSRRFIKNDILQEDFFISEKNENNSWEPSKNYGDNLNTYGNEGAFSFSVDKEMAIFTACDREDRIGRCDLYLLIAGETYNAGNIINSKEWDSQGCFSPDGKYLYFVSSREGGYGGKDIWRSEITAEGFLEPENLGPNINTSFNEMSPFLHPDNITLYFASDGHIGMGDYDIFICRRESTINKWNKPENMGYPINTFNIENSLVVANNGTTAYYASDKTGFGKEDIFQFELPKHLQADSLAELEMDIITQKVGEEVILRDVSFTSNSYDLDKSSFVELDKLISYLIKNPDLQIEIQGHTDDIGNKIDNQLLSDKRARSVFEYLKVRVSNSLRYQGFGESVPLETNATKKGRAINRRTSFIILN